MKSQGAYIKDSGNCPCCDSHQIEGSSFDHDGDGVSQRINCNDCGASWVDIHKLVSFLLIKGPDEEG